MVTALFPGSFDPVTNGHLDLVARAAQIFDHVVVAVGFNMAKPGWMPVAQRVELLRRTVEDQLELDNVSVGQFEGLTTDYAEHVGATVIIKGGRSSADWDWEYTQAAVNRRLSGIDTLILPADSQWATLSHQSSGSWPGTVLLWRGWSRLWWRPPLTANTANCPSNRTLRP